MTGGVSVPETEGPVPPSVPDVGATNTPNPGETAPTSGNHGSGDLRAPHPLDRARVLAELIDPQAFHGDWAHEETQREHMDRALHFAIKVVDAGWTPQAPSSPDARADLVAILLADYPGSWSRPLESTAEAMADAILGAGYRRVSEDGDTAERRSVGMCGNEAPRIAPGGERVVCELLHGHAGWHESGRQQWTSTEPDDATVERVARAIHAVSLGGLNAADAVAAWDELQDGYTRNVALAKARAAVRALREDTA